MQDQATSSVAASSLPSSSERSSSSALHADVKEGFFFIFLNYQNYFLAFFRAAAPPL